MPPAPRRFSTTTLWPSDFDIAAATERATTSVGPPAANGTTMVMGRDGYGSAAWLRPGRVRATAAAMPSAAHSTFRQ
ncbi:hypothetical protein D3C87_1644650 [compost metagenome]